MVIRINKDIVNFDPFFYSSLTTIESAWMERLFTNDWTLDPSVFRYTAMFRPNEFVKGQLAQSWEFTDPTTLAVHLRQGIHWQNIAPANGREFVADDVAFKYNRLFDPVTGGFTKGGPFASGSNLPLLISVTAPDKYTVLFKWKTSNPELIYETVQLGAKSELCIENPDVVKLYGDATDWHHAIGTGPFILKDFVSGASATLVKNPDYWGYDERYPQNKLPYVDTLKILVITDNSTALAGLRAGKLDALDQMPIQTAMDMKKSNPEIAQIKIPFGNGISIDPRRDTAPFKDIKVIKAMQMAIDLPTIATTYYQGTVQPYPVGNISQYMTGWGFMYKDWPQDLKDEYAYNPTAAKKLLADAGYPSGFKTNVVVDSGHDMDLLAIVKSYFMAVGIDMEIRVMDNASWQSFVGTGHKQDQLASLSTGGITGKAVEPIVSLNKFIKSMAPNNYLMYFDQAYDDFYAKAVATTSVDEVKKIVRDQDEYWLRQHATISLLQPMTFTFVQPWLKGHDGQYGATYGSWGPSYLFFYPARFWIDQNAKKVLGH